MPYLRIVRGRFAVVGIRCNEGIQIRATDPEARTSVRADVAARVVNAENPAVQGTEVRNFEVRIALLEGRATTDFAFRSQAGLASRGSVPKDAPTLPRSEFQIDRCCKLSFYNSLIFIRQNIKYISFRARFV